MFRGALRFFGGVLLVGIAGYLLRVPWYFTLLVGAALGAVLAGIGWYLRKDLIYTQKLLAGKPFDGQLPYEVGMATETAIALEGDDTYSQRVAGERAFHANFVELMDYADYTDGEVLEVQCALVAEPANPDSRHAVAVTCGGSVLGYIPEFESEPLFVFLMQNRGIARVNSNIHFDIRGRKSFVELDLTRPYTKVERV